MTNSKKKKFIIIDGNALIHRSFHALPPLTIKSGEMVNAVYGFTTVLLKALREFQPDYIALTLDRKEKTFRHKQYDKYKANRVKAPDELYEQIPKVKEIAKAFNIPIFELAGFEADDLIGTLVKRVDSDVKKIIVTGDLDALQLVDENTEVFTMKHGLTDSVLYDIEAVKQRYNLLPEQMIDFKSLRGDPSDNIPGVKGIGEKTAIDLLQNFKTLEGVYQYVEKEKQPEDKIRPRIVELLKQYKEDAFLSKELATIKCDVQFDFELNDANFGSFDREKVAKLFSNFEFNSLLPRLYNLPDNNLDKQSEQTDEIMDKFARNKTMFKYHLINSDDKFEEFFKQLNKQKEFVFDTETSNCDPINAELLGISFSWKTGEAYYIEVKSQKPKVKSLDLFNYNSKTESQNFLDNKWIEKLKPIFEDGEIKKYGHNIKYDIKVITSIGIKAKGTAGDSMIASYLLNPGSRKHNLDIVTFNEFNFQKISKKDLLGDGKDKISFGEVSVDKLYVYSCEDADFTFRLIKKLISKLEKEKLINLFLEIEMPLVEVLAQMEINGIKIDIKFLAQIKEKVDKKIYKLIDKIHQLAGEKFNVNSTQQLRKILFEKLEIPTTGIAKTKTGLSTGADELKKLKDQHPIIILIQEYRELSKLSSTYIEALPKLINEKTGRVHTSFNQSITATGRLSSTEPNLQNIPARTEIGREIRQAFVAEKGYQLLSLDYSQIELRLAAHMSDDKKMIKAFNDNLDIHKATAAAINEIALSEVTAEMRQQAKAINFGILYGQGPHGLSQNANIPYNKAKEFIEQYFKVYQDVKIFIDKTIELAHTQGYVETLFNRRRYLPEINSLALQVKKTAERMAINMPMQGTSADIIKIAMIKVKKMIDEDYLIGDVKMLLQVHDELVFEVKENLVEKAAIKIKNIMEQVVKLKVPLIAEVKVGENWGKMREV
ncbi:MAG: DNA polymerase I [Patescibacteria group bacterium]|nr:DNA polymerase I [Patescibacteria group bacterium]MBU0879429.1 DNA polymerase I [Patescibacteria group bacterium]MBU0879958.1 DNA polymerase I [Patescibacteria group bacterium]MBU1783151.1 DNA polymerase I [Patescibacteria group bacterium]MBU2081641.1 DNA polymerase I [Patescibacteria group bacterium]